jgi:hypothetical protein
VAVIQSKKTFAVQARHSLLHVDPTNLVATKESIFIDACQIDAAEWLSFNQKRIFQERPGTPFSALTPPSLPQPKRAASLMRLQRMINFLEFQSIFKRMNCQIDAA